MKRDFAVVNKNEVLTIIEISNNVNECDILYIGSKHGCEFYKSLYEGVIK